MIEIGFEATQVAAIYHGGNKEAREALKEALGDQFSTILPIEERVKTFDDAYSELGEDHPLCKEYRSVKHGYLLEIGKDLIAYLQLRIITAALNEGWEPQFVEGERRWYGWYDLISKEDYERLSDEEKSRCVGRSGSNAHSYGGLVYSSASYASSVSYAAYGSRLAFKSEKLAAYAAQQFIDIYADFCFIPSTDKE